MNRYYYAGHETLDDPFKAPNVHNINIGDEYVRNKNMIAWSGGIPAAYFTVTSEPYLRDPRYKNFIVIDVDAYYDTAHYMDPVKWPRGERKDTVSVDWLWGDQPYFIPKEKI